MLVLRSLISALISNWQFFKESTLAPVIEVNVDGADWQELSLRPKSQSFFDIVKSLFFNPHWNEALFIMDCAERLVLEKSQEDEDELTERIKLKLSTQNAKYFEFRIIFISKDQKEIVFNSDKKELS